MSLIPNWISNKKDKVVDPDRFYKTYLKLCPEPIKDKENLPDYWDSLTILEKVRWVRENIKKGQEEDYIEILNNPPKKGLFKFLGVI